MIRKRSNAELQTLLDEHNSKPNQFVCEHCGCLLALNETITCNECHIVSLQALLDSKEWCEVRGPEMVATIRAELSMLKHMT